MARLTLPFIVLLSFVVTVYSAENDTTPTPSSTPATPTTASPTANPAKGVMPEIVKLAAAIPKAIVSAFSTGFQEMESIFGGK